MAKSKTVYTCSECGSQAPKWSGQCGDCGAWNSLVETAAVVPAARGGRFAGYAGQQAAPVQELSQVRPERETRTPVGFGELDRVLGGGLVAGSVILIGGDPGIGKSTLLLQALAAFKRSDFAGIVPAHFRADARILLSVALRAGQNDQEEANQHDCGRSLHGSPPFRGWCLFEKEQDPF